MVALPEVRLSDLLPTDILIEITSYNTMGSKMYPPGTSHWKPGSQLFKDNQRPSLNPYCPINYPLTFIYR